MTTTPIVTALDSSIVSPVGGLTTVQVGDYQTDGSKLPFIREQTIGLYATGMKPNTVLYVYFDSTAISQFVTPATLDFSIINPQVTDFIPTAPRGTYLTSDANGNVSGILYIPALKFFVGTKTIIITDVPNLASFNSCTTSATFLFNAFNFTTSTISGTTQTNTSTTTNDNTSTSTKVVSTRPVTNVTENNTDNSTTQTNTIITPPPPPPPSPPTPLPTLVLNANLPDAKIGAAYSGIVAPSGGKPPYSTTWALNGAPTGLLATAGAAGTVSVTGIPTGTGLFYSASITVTVNDSNGGSTTQTYPINVFGTSAANTAADGGVKAANGTLVNTPMTETLVRVRRRDQDPIAQSFYVDENRFKNLDGIYVTSVDLFFQTKDPILGVTVDIVTVQNGLPTSTSIPFSSKTMKSSEINISSLPDTPTRIVFPSPVFLSSGNYYALRITPDGDNPNYTIYTCEVGKTDLLTNTPVTKNWGSGDMFNSTNGNTWVPLQNEFLKFNLYMANFTTNIGSIKLVNKDYEFLMVSNNVGTFNHGEYVFQYANALFSNTTNSGAAVVMATNSQVVHVNTSSNAAFTNSVAGFTVLNPGNKIVVSNGSAFDILTVANVSNSTVINIVGYPKFSTSNGTIQITPLGTVDFYDRSKFSLTLDNSTANSSSFCFKPGNIIIGTESCAGATIATVRNRVINRFNPYLSTVQYQNAQVQYDMKNTVKDEYTDTPFTTYPSNKTSHILDNEVIIASKTNEIIYRSGNKSLVANVIMTTSNNFISPALDLQSASIVTDYNLINNSLYLENTKNGRAVNKYISKTVTLAPGLDAEAFTTYINAYWPPAANVAVYGKFLSSNDPGLFDDKDWTLLEQVGGNGLYSDPYNLNDIKEYQFKIPVLPPTDAKTGVIITHGNTTISGTATAFTQDVAVNDLIVLYQDSALTMYQVAKVVNITNDSTLTIDTPVGFSNTVIGRYSIITQPNQAFLNDLNHGIVRYYANGVPYDTFITFAIKIDLLSQYSYQVPRILSLRSVATSV